METLKISTSDLWHKHIILGCSKQTNDISFSIRTSNFQKNNEAFPPLECQRRSYSGDWWLLMLSQHCLSLLAAPAEVCVQKQSGLCARGDLVVGGLRDGWTEEEFLPSEADEGGWGKWEEGRSPFIDDEEEHHSGCRITEQFQAEKGGQGKDLKSVNM